MKIAIDLLKADHVGIRDLKADLSQRLHADKPLVVTDHGIPVNVILPYSDMMELLDLVDEVTDPKLVALVLEGRKAIQSGNRGIPVGRLFTKRRELRSKT